MAKKKTKPAARPLNKKSMKRVKGGLLPAVMPATSTQQASLSVRPGVNVTRAYDDESPKE